MNYGPRIIRSGLVLALDVIDVNSFVANQKTWKDLTGNNYGTLNHDSLLYNIKDNSSLFLMELMVLYILVIHLY